MPWATAVGLWDAVVDPHADGADDVAPAGRLDRAPAHSTSPMAGRRKRIDSSDVSAIGSIRPIAANTTYQSAASARPNCVGPEMYPPGRMSAAVAT